MVNCPNCGKELDDVVDTTYSNYKSDRAENGQHTGDIYSCDECEILVIDDFLNNVVREWDY